MTDSAPPPEARAQEPQRPGLARGDLFLAASYSSALCGLLLWVAMSYEDPTRTYLRLLQLPESLGLQLGPHEVVWVLVRSIWLGLFLMSLGLRARSPALELLGESWRELLHLFAACLVAGLLLLLGGCSWLAVAVLS